MRIWIDGQCLQTASRLRGIGRYTLSLIKEIVNQNPDLDIIVSLSSAMPNEALTAKNMLCEFMDQKSLRFWQPTKIEPEAISGYNHQRKASEIALATHVDTINPDVVFSMSPFEGAYDFAVPYNPAFKCQQKIVQIFYDAIPERYPQQYFKDSGYKKMYFRRKKYYEQSDLILSISDFTNSEAIELFQGVKSKPIYAGVDKSLFKKNNYISVKEQKYDFLYVGALDFRKNVLNLVNAMGVIFNDLKATKNFAVVGFYDQDGKDDIKRLWKTLGLPDEQLHFVGKVNDDELLENYKLAKVVVQPSLMEGFGLTALEAILTDTCVAGSRDTALQEIIKDQRALFDPLDPDEMARVLLSLSDDHSLRRDVLSAQKQSLTDFTWEKSAKLAMKYINELDINTQQLNVDDIRKRTISRITDVRRYKSIKMLADVLAANENQQSDRLPIFAIDITETAIKNQGTGIQKVVCKTIDSVGSSLSEIKFDHTLLFCRDWEGWRNVGKTITKASPKHNDFIAKKGDVILLLDSSWNYHKMHREALWDARFKGVEVISCLYDTIPLKHTAFSGTAMGELFSQWLRTALSYSSGFVCISKTVADELHEILITISYPNELKIGYWHLGADFKTSRSQQRQIKSQAIANKRISILMVGTIEPRKAHSVALSAFEQIWMDQTKKIELIIVGKIGWAGKELLSRLNNHPELNNRLFVKDRVTDDELSELYANCDALLACSFAEGFGLPIVEAGQMGKPVIASDIPVFREVAESAPATFFFKVGCPNALKKTIEKFVANYPPESNLDVPNWLNWQESTDKLVDVVLNENWYVHYKPSLDRLTSDPDYIGQTFMTTILEGPKRKHQIKFLEDKPNFDEHGALVLTVIISNLSETIFSSDDAPFNKKNMPINIVVMTTPKSGNNQTPKLENIDIPFPIIPGNTVFYPLRIKQDKMPKSDFELTVKLSQTGGVDWDPGVSMHIIV